MKVRIIQKKYEKKEDTIHHDGFYPHMKVRIKKEYLKGGTGVGFIVDQVYECVRYRKDQYIFTFPVNVGCLKYPQYKHGYSFHINWLDIIEK